jgi:hypothetical protein
MTPISSDLETSAAWWARGLGRSLGPNTNGPNWQWTLMLAVVIGLQTHERTPEGDLFGEARSAPDAETQENRGLQRISSPR